MFISYSPEIEVHLNYEKIVKKCRRDIYDDLQENPYADFPPGHPRDINRPNSPQTMTNKDCRVTLKCPAVGCTTKYAGGKRKKMLDHIQLSHPGSIQELQKVLNELYPPRVIKSTSGFTCIVCNKFLRQSITHLSNHHKKKHPNVAFMGPKESQLS